jgi:hypothetical protein
MTKQTLRFFIVFLLIEFGAICFTPEVNSSFHFLNGPGVLMASPSEDGDDDDDDIDQPPDPILHSPIPQDTVFLSDGTIIIIHR